METGLSEWNRESAITLEFPGMCLARNLMLRKSISQKKSIESNRSDIDLVDHILLINQTTDMLSDWIMRCDARRSSAQWDAIGMTALNSHGGALPNGTLSE